MVLIVLLVSSMMYTFILAYNVIMTIIYCNKMDKANSVYLYNKYDSLSNDTGKEVLTSLYASSLFWLAFFLVWGLS